MPSKNQECKAEGCSKQADGGKGYCRRHFAAWKRGGMPKGRYDTCQAEGCHKRVKARGRCEEHFARDYPGKKAAAGAGAAEAPAEAAEAPAAE
jgi:hypothetical protein